MNFDSLQVIVREIAAHRAVVLVAAASDDQETQQLFDAGKVSATIRGPRCELAKTLPAGFSLSKMMLGEHALLRGVITDPSFWSSDLPAIYDVTIRIPQNSSEEFTIKRSIGVRPVSRSKQYVVREGKVWIPRIVRPEAIDGEAAIADYRNQLAAALVPLNADAQSFQEFADRASRTGCYVIANIHAACESDQLRAVEIARQFPAVMMVCFAPEHQPTATVLAAASGLLIGTIIAADEESSSSDLQEQLAWAGVLIVEAATAGAITALAQRASFRGPVIAMRKLTSASTLATARDACDRLQSDLATLAVPFLPFAGFVV